MTSPTYRPAYIIPRQYVALVNPRGPARDAAERAALTILECGNETWYIDAEAQRIEATAQRESEVNE